jgi:RNA-directed DNA polymerase
MSDDVISAPDWLCPPLPAFAPVDAELIQKITNRAGDLPESLRIYEDLLAPIRDRQEYDAVVNVANAFVWRAIDRCLENTSSAFALCRYAEKHFPQQANSRLIRRLIVHPGYRRWGQYLLRRTALHEVAIPNRRLEEASSFSWMAGRAGTRRPGSSKRRLDQGVPDIATVGELRELLAIRSPAQLGFFLSAVSEKNGPYRSFTIEKKSGESRQISAPCPSLLWTQRRILKRVLAPLTPHENAHGFIIDRSIVTNAMSHVGARLIVKFDLRDFFPSISERRVVGLFGSMGYHIGTGQFSADDRSRNVAPVLARLTCIAQTRQGAGALPQGAPTSPAISNLLCRRLDERLTGLATKFGGFYTRYADDLTFSFRDEILVGRLRWWVEQICFREGFTVRQDKFRAIRNSQQQRVTGVIVNERLNVSRAQRRRIRAMLHQCRRDGVAVVNQRHPGVASYMKGYAAYVQMVDPMDQGQLMREVKEVLGEMAE